MNIKDIRGKTKLSQSQFAKKLNIPVRTIQQWEQEKSSPPQYVIQLISDKLNQTDNFFISKYKIKEKTNWKECINPGFLNCSKIHPLQQGKVKSLLDDLCDNKDIIKLIVFGSSVTNQCHIGSDIDLYVEMKKDYNPITKAYPFEIDFWNNFRVDQSLINEIKNKGVIVYGEQ